MSKYQTCCSPGHRMIFTKPAYRKTYIHRASISTLYLLVVTKADHLAVINLKLLPTTYYLILISPNHISYSKKFYSSPKI